MVQSVLKRFAESDNHCRSCYQIELLRLFHYLKPATSRDLLRANTLTNFVIKDLSTTTRKAVKSSGFKVLENFVRGLAGDERHLMNLRGRKSVEVDLERGVKPLDHLKVEGVGELIVVPALEKESGGSKVFCLLNLLCHRIARENVRFRIARIVAIERAERAI